MFTLIAMLSVAIMQLILLNTVNAIYNSSPSSSLCLYQLYFPNNIIVRSQLPFMSSTVVANDLSPGPKDGSSADTIISLSAPHKRFFAGFTIIIFLYYSAHY
jgi:hypothetical protein